MSYIYNLIRFLQNVCQWNETCLNGVAFSVVIFHANDSCYNIMVSLAVTIGRHNHQQS